MKPLSLLGRVGEVGVALDVEVCKVAVAVAGMADPIILCGNPKPHEAHQAQKNTETTKRDSETKTTPD